MRRWVCIGLVLLATVGLRAQDATPPAPAADSAKEIAELKAQIAALTAQVQRASQPSPAEQQEQAKKALADLYASAKRASLPSCKAAGGRLSIEIDNSGKTTVICTF